MSNKKTAKERLDSLEEQVMDLHHSNLALATITENQRLAVVELSDKLDALIFLSEREGKVSEETIKEQRKTNAIENMKSDINEAIEKGALTKVEVVGSRSFIVVQEKDKKGNIQIDAETQNYVMKSKPAFDKEYKELLEVTVTIGQISFEELGNISIKPEVLEVLVGTVIQEPS